jgi:hypothetical protein
LRPVRPAIRQLDHDDELTGRVDMVSVGMQQFGGMTWRMMVSPLRAKVALRLISGLFAGRTNPHQPPNLSVVVAAGNQDFASGRSHEKGTFCVLPDVRPDGGQGNRRRHQTSVSLLAEHQSLVASTLIFGFLAVYALGDVGRLFTDDVDHRHRTGAVVASKGIANILDCSGPVFRSAGAGSDFAADNSSVGFSP